MADKAPRNNAKSTTRKTTSAPRQQNAVTLLRADHKEVSAMFDAYEKARSPATKSKLVGQICTALTVHAQIEEEIFYPAFKQALKDKELVPEAAVEHATLKHLISQVEGVAPDGEMYDAKIKVMSEYVKHHVKEEQNEIFPKAKSSKLDLDALGEQLAERKQQLMAEHRT